MVPTKTKKINKNLCCKKKLQRTKCEAFSWPGEMTDNVIPGFTLAGTDVDGRFKPGLICVRALIGTDSYVKKMMGKKVSELRVEVKKTENLGRTSTKKMLPFGHFPNGGGSTPIQKF